MDNMDISLQNMVDRFEENGCEIILVATVLMMITSSTLISLN